MQRARQLEALDRLVKKKEAASILGVSPRTIERVVSSGKLPKIKIRGSVLFKLSDVLSLGELQPATP